MKKEIIALVLILNFSIFINAQEDSGAMKDFVMKGHMLTEIDLSYCSFETLIMLYPNYNKISIKSSTFPNSPKDSTIEEYDFKNFSITIYRWKNGINSYNRNMIFSEILEVRAKSNIVYLNGIHLGMKKNEIEKKLGNINVEDFESIHKMMYFFDLVFKFDNNDTLIDLIWRRELGD